MGVRSVNQKIKDDSKGTGSVDIGVWYGDRGRNQETERKKGLQSIIKAKLSDGKIKQKVRAHEALYIPRVLRQLTGDRRLLAEKGTDPHKSLSELILTVSILAAAPILIRSKQD